MPNPDPARPTPRVPCKDLACILYQQTKGIALAGDGLGARLRLSHESIHEVEIGIDTTPSRPTYFWTASAVLQRLPSRCFSSTPFDYGVIMHPPAKLYIHEYSLDA